MERYYSKRRISPIIRLLIFSIIPTGSVLLYKRLVNPFASIVTQLIILLIGVFLAVILRSFLINPRQFIQALYERIRWVFTMIYAGFLVILNILRALFFLSLRFIFWFFALIVYIVSPIDIVPDILFPVGYLDDGLFTILFLRFVSFGIGQSIKEEAQMAIENGRIETPFP